MLKRQYFSHLIGRTDSLEKTLILEKIEGRRTRGQQRMRWLDGITDLMDRSLSKLRVGDGQGSPACCSTWGRKELDMTEWLNWLTVNKLHKDNNMFLSYIYIQSKNKENSPIICLARFYKLNKWHKIGFRKFYLLPYSLARKIIFSLEKVE